MLRRNRRKAKKSPSFYPVTGTAHSIWTVSAAMKQQLLTSSALGQANQAVEEFAECSSPWKNNQIPSFQQDEALYIRKMTLFQAL